jgi:site-specific DNA recombinase
MAKRTAVYCRISNDKEGAGVKVEDQRRDCLALAERLGLKVDPRDHKDGGDVYTDNDIGAYKNRPRPGYEALIAGIEAGHVGTVLAWHTDRINRNYEVAAHYIGQAERHNVITHTVQAGRWDLSNATSRATAHTQAIWAFHESALKAERQRAANLHRAERGQWNGRTRPFGYEVDGVTVREEEAATVRWAASEILAGTSLRAVTRDLNRRGVRTATGKAWEPKTIGNMLQRARLAGYAVYHGEIVGKAQWPAILDDDTWRGVCAILSDPTRRKQNGTARKWLLSGLARCGHDGCDLTVKSATRSGKAAGGMHLHAYECRSGGHVWRNAEEVDQYVEAVIIERLSRPDARDLLVPDLHDDTTALHQRDAALVARKDELGRLYGDGVIDAAQLAQGTAAIRRQRDDLRHQLAAAARGSVLAGVADAEDAADAWARLDLSRRRAVVDTLIEVTILPARRGNRKGRKPGESMFDPATVAITWKR